MADALWLCEADVVALLDLPGAIDALGRGLAALATNRAATLAKAHLATPGGATLHALGGWLAHAAGGSPMVGTKTWAHTAGGASPLLLLWNADDGELLAVIEAFALGQLRTGATSGVAAGALAPAGTRIGALAGTGRQAVAQAAAMCVAAPLTELRVFSPDPAHRAACIGRAREAGLEVELIDAASLAEAVDGAELITLATRSSDPILHAPMVTVSAHVNAIGAISTERAEVAPDLVASCALVVADDPDTARRLAPRELAEVDEIVSLADLLEQLRSPQPPPGEAAPGTGSDPASDPAPDAGPGVAPGADRGGGPGPGAGRPPDADLTLFKAMGLGVSDVVLGAEVLALAAATDRGRPLPRHQPVPPRLVRRFTP